MVDLTVTVYKDGKEFVSETLIRPTEGELTAGILRVLAEGRRKTFPEPMWPYSFEVKEVS